MAFLRNESTGLRRRLGGVQQGHVHPLTKTITAAFHDLFQEVNMRSSQLCSLLLTAGIRKIRFLNH